MTYHEAVFWTVTSSIDTNGPQQYNSKLRNTICHELDKMAGNLLFDTKYKKVFTYEKNKIKCMLNEYDGLEGRTKYN